MDTHDFESLEKISELLEEFGFEDVEVSRPYPFTISVKAKGDYESDFAVVNSLLEKPALLAINLTVAIGPMEVVKIAL